MPPPTTLPVGLASLGVPVLGQQVSPAPLSTRPIALPCGYGPALQIDGTSESTSVTGSLGDLIDLQPMNVRVCGTPVAFSVGRHTISFPAGSAFRMTSLFVDSSQKVSAGVRPVRSARVLSWSSSSRKVAVGAGSTTYLQVAQNFSAGWVATFDGKTLAPVVLDGWEQGWMVPAGTAGTVSMTFTPDHLYRAGLLLGGLLLVLLFVLALVGRDRSATDPIGPRRKLPVAALAVVAGFVAVCVGGWLALLLVPLVAIVHRWGDDVDGGNRGHRIRHRRCDRRSGSRRRHSSPQGDIRRSGSIVVSTRTLRGAERRDRRRTSTAG